jgi:His-Xaa-Ser system radical SAM maturase HxsC|tara:strand:+ start:5357 stop:6514 length:1158 start_codon:yes stop_codon:yes gene_type:complete
LKQLLHYSNNFSSKINGVRKVVFNQDEYVDGDTVLFTAENIDIKDIIDLVITTSIEIYNKYSENKQILYFECIEEMEEYAILKLERNSIYLSVLPSSNAHTLFFTNKCNHYCLMCSQPPTTDNDDYLIEDNMKIIELIDKNLPVIGISGGEPTLLASNFIKIVKKIRKELPNTYIRVLTNGRAYSNEKFVKAIADVARDYFISEIPIYSSFYAQHDYVVQSKNAFFETIEGFYNCSKHDLKTEVRVVLNKQTYKNLPELMYFIYKNIPFIDHIALMGMEYIGFTLNNIEEVHISPLKYEKELVNAIKICKEYSLPVSIYNLPLCLVNKNIRNFAKQSISDWKNEFSEVCYNCQMKNECAGMFTSTQPYFEALLNPIERSQYVTKD